MTISQYKPAVPQWQKDLIKESTLREDIIQMLANSLEEVLTFKYHKSFIDHKTFIGCLEDIYKYPKTAYKYLPKSHPVWEEIILGTSSLSYPDGVVKLKFNNERIFITDSQLALFRQAFIKKIGLYAAKIDTTLPEARPISHENTW